MTLSENVHKFAELSQRIVVERSVIQTYEQTKNNTKTMEICMENYKKKTVSTSSSKTDKLNDVLFPSHCENNGDIKDSEKLVMVEKKDNNTSSAEITMTTTTTNGGGGVDDGGKGVNGNDGDDDDDNNKNKNKNNKGSEALTSNIKLIDVTVQRPLKPQSEMDFLVPYNIINNYFSVGVVSITIIVQY